MEQSTLTFGNYLRSVRTKKKMSIRQLAMYSGTSHSYLSQVERGERGVPSPEILSKIAKPLNVSYNELMDKAGYLSYGNSSLLNEEDAVFDTVAGYSEIAGFWEELKNREDLQLLFKQTKDLSPESIRRIIKIIKAIEDEEDQI